jgi:hypothetical protein
VLTGREGLLSLAHPHHAARAELLLTTAGLHLAGGGLLALLLCAAGLRGVEALFGDWAALTAALLPAIPQTRSLIAPLFCVPLATSGALSAERPQTPESTHPRTTLR